YLVPLARARRQVMHHDIDADFRGKTLQFNLPQSRARSIAAAAIGGDGQPRGGPITLVANLAPPAANGLHREGRGVVVDANTDPAGIGREVVDAIGRRPAELLDQKVMHPDFFGVAFRAPRPAGVLE